jgi:hypothetical protein
MPIRYERVRVTKTYARQLLETNVEYNRNPKVNTKVLEYRGDMNEGRWDSDTGETIKVTKPSAQWPNGQLIDGQNRMLAFQGSELRSIEFDFAYDVPEKAFEVIDSGAARTFSDVSKKYGVGPERNVNGAIVRRILLWERGNRINNKGGNIVGGRPTKRMLLARWQEDVGGFDAASRRGADVSRAKLGQAGVAGSAFYLFAQIDKDLANSFLDMVLTGENLPAGHPALWLGKKLLKDRDLLWADEQMVLWIKLWNMFRKDETVDRTVSIVGFRGRPYTNDTFPVPE